MQRSQARLTLGELLAAAGALLLVGSMFRPWYELNLPESLVTRARSATGQFGDFGAFLQQGLDELQRQGGIPVKAWDVFESADIVLAVAAAAVLGAVALNAAGALTRSLGGVIVLAGLVAAGIVTFKLVSPPGSTPLIDEQLLSPQPAIYAALLGSLLMLGGGIHTLLSDPAPRPAPTPPPSALAAEVRIWDAS